MPRSKRKAKTQQDFVTKKQKLGKKTRADNFTDTNVRRRQIHVPNQTRQSSTTGPPIQELLSKCRHHNANTRITSLNTLTNALTDTNATAHIALNAPLPVLSTALQSLSDHHANVRSAGLQLIRRLIQHVDYVPFKSIITNSLLASLTHIRSDISIDAANATTILPSQVLSKSPLQELSHLLTLQQPKAKIAALAAIASLSEHQQSQKPRIGRFCYHYQTHVPPSQNFFASLSQSETATLITRVAETVLEHLQNPPRTILTSCLALAAVVENGVPPEAAHPVLRVLKSWKYTTDTYPLAKVALSQGNEQQCASYVVTMLKRPRYNDSLDTIVRHCVHLPRVCSEFADTLHSAVERHDTVFVRRSFKAAVNILQQGDPTSLIKEITPAVKILKDGDEEIGCELVKAACNAWKRCIRDVHLAEKLLSVCASPLVTDVVDDVIGVAICAGVLTSDICVGVLGECVRQRRMKAVQRFIRALEWTSSCPGDDRFKAIAILRALARIAGDDLADVSTRLEALV